MLNIEYFSEQLQLRKNDPSYLFALEMGKVYDEEGLETDSYRDYLFKCPVRSTLVKVSGNIELVKIKPVHFNEYDLVAEGVLPIVYKPIKD